jgi:predicted Fe-Mo cluster-binding NifX family protein
MKIVVSASGNSLDSPVDPRFGRCAYFVFVDPDSLEFEPFANESAMASGGAGIQAAQFVANQGAEAVITGNVGPNASMTLNAAGMQVFLGATGTVRNAVEMYKQGQLQMASGPSVPGHFGMGQPTPGATPGPVMGGGMGRGMGMGRAMGRAMGRGMGAGMGMGPGSMPPPQPPSAGGPGQQDLEALKSQVKGLQDQMEKISEKLSELRKKGKQEKSRKKREK